MCTEQRSWRVGRGGGSGTGVDGVGCGGVGDGERSGVVDGVDAEATAGTTLPSQGTIGTTELASLLVRAATLLRCSLRTKTRGHPVITARCVGNAAATRRCGSAAVSIRMHNAPSTRRSGGASRGVHRVSAHRGYGVGCVGIPTSGINLAVALALRFFLSQAFLFFNKTAVLLLEDSAAGYATECSMVQTTVPGKVDFPMFLREENFGGSI